VQKILAAGLPADKSGDNKDAKKPDPVPSTSPTVADLLGKLKDKDVATRLSAAKALVPLLKDAKEVDIAAILGGFLEAMKDQDPDLRQFAAKSTKAALDAAKTPKVKDYDDRLADYIAGLSKMLDKDKADAVERLLAAKALEALGPDAKCALPSLRDATANDPDDDVKKVAVNAIQKISATK
jgi:hypothetical protein